LANEEPVNLAGSFFYLVCVRRRHTRRRDLAHQRDHQRAGDAVHGHTAALKRLWSITWREAQTQTYADAFLAIGACFVVATHDGGS
jgi:hypothetical protein